MKKFLSLLVFFVGLQAHAANLDMEYECQIGEKPGVPVYRLKISNEKFEIQKKTDLSSTTEISAKGVLDQKDQDKLASILTKLQSMKAPAPAGELEGSYTLKYSMDDKKTLIQGGSAKTVKEISDFTQWIKSFHKKYPGLKNIHPLIPGDICKRDC